MIANMPKFAQAPIQNYLETGQFRDHSKEQIPTDKEEIAQMLEQTETFIAADNSKDDMDPRPGKIETTDDFFGPVKAEYERSEDGKSLETFFNIGSGDMSAVVYTRNSPESLDVITVTPNGGSDDGVMHFSHNDPNGSFMTFKD
jgi:hypothetical protein